MSMNARFPQHRPEDTPVTGGAFLEHLRNEVADPTGAIAKVLRKRGIGLDPHKTDFHAYLAELGEQALQSGFASVLSPRDRERVRRLIQKFRDNAKNLRMIDEIEKGPDQSSQS